ncbi:MAG TPA: hypothetical protein VFW31_16725 [Candidatus Angelobacter sp.]|nr:hypothetical protein [Candidatus Angelobacter sp.]
MAGITKKIEIATNIAIIMTALVIAASFVRNYEKKNDEPKAIAAGETLRLKDLQWQSENKTLVLALSTNCHFCNESAEFYKRLVIECKRRKIQTVAIFPQPVIESTAHLQSLGIAVDQVRQVFLPQIRITGTPTLLLVDHFGTVDHVWIGKLTSKRENEVFVQLD